MQDSFDFDFREEALRDLPVYVAGGSGGLGAALVCLLAREGARVIAGYRSNRQRAEQLQSHVRDRYQADIELMEGDLADPDSRLRQMQKLDQIPGGLYGLVCCTGDPARVPLEKLHDRDLIESFAENYAAPVLLARDAASLMRRQGRSGAVVLVSSMQAVVPFSSSLNYAGPKAGLIHAARILARELGGPGGIRVNVVAPGVNAAGMALQSIRSGKYDRFVEKGIVPRFGRAEDVARAVRLLLEPDNYITGQLLTVDGGLTLRRDLG